MNQLMISVILTFLSLRHGSQSCRFHEQNFSDVEQILVQTFKKKLLKELGFSSAPNVSQARVPKIPSFYKHFIEAENNKPNEATGLDENAFDARTKQLFYFSKQVVSLTNGSGKNYIFKSDSRYSNLKIKSATLWIHVTESKSAEKKPDHGNCELQLYKEYRRASENGSRQLFHSEHLKAAGWHKVTVTSLVREWFSLHPGAELTLDFAMKGATSLVISGDEATQPLEPFLAVETDEKQHFNRKKRGVELAGCSPTPPKTCCLHNLMIDFLDIDINYIIFPVQLNFTYCTGSCETQGFFDNRERQASIKKSRLIGRTPCCVPKTMSSVSLLVMATDQSVTYVRLPNMVATSCHCNG